MERRQGWSYGSVEKGALPNRRLAHEADGKAPVATRGIRVCATASNILASLRSCLVSDGKPVMPVGRCVGARWGSVERNETAMKLARRQDDGHNFKIPPSGCT